LHRKGLVDRRCPDNQTLWCRLSDASLLAKCQRLTSGGSLAVVS
jgi:hypothetical protein